jgi:hypothetical protein
MVQQRRDQSSKKIKTIERQVLALIGKMTRKFSGVSAPGGKVRFRWSEERGEVAMEW